MYDERDLVEFMVYIRLVDKKDTFVEDYIHSKEGKVFLQDLKKKIIKDIIEICKQKGVTILEYEIELIVDKIFADILKEEIE